MRRLLGLLVIFFIGTPVVLASRGQQGAAFLQIPVGAGPAAMGSAYSALATDAYAPVWNPAGLGFLSVPELAAQHLSYLESINYEQLSFGIPLRGPRAEGAPPGSLGGSIQYVGTGEITGRGPGGDLTGSFSNHFAAYTMAYGHRFKDRWSMGLATRWINAKLGDYTANAYAVDLGALYHPEERLSAALTMTNLGSRLKFINESDSLPTAVHTAVAVRPWRPWLMSLEGVFETQGAANGHFGVEWRPIDNFGLRAGYRSDALKELSALAGFSTGVGLTFWGQEFAYAWVPYGDLGDTQYFSLLLKFGASEERKNLIQYQHIQKHLALRNDNASSDVGFEELLQLISKEQTHTVQSPGQREQP